MTIDPLAQRQLDLGAASWFRPEPEDPVGNQLRVRKGFLYAGADRVIDAFTGGDQLTPGFSSVSSSGLKRYDLVYLDATGTVQVLPGNEVATASADFVGAPGFTSGPALPDQAIPVAYVLIDEVTPSTPVIESGDITQITGLFYLGFDLDGYMVDKGLLGSAPAGASDDVSGLFASETAGGGSSQAGVVTSAPLNYVHLLDQNGDEILHTSGARMFGRLTESGGVWTLTYLYLDAAGAETSMDPSTDATVVPTDLRLVGVPKVFSKNDPNRPLFDSAVTRLSDQLAGDIPLASETAPGKVQLAADGDTAAGEAVQGSDTRLGAVRGRANAGAVSGLQGVVRLIAGSNVSVSLTESGGELQFTINAGGGSGPSASNATPNPDSGGGSAGGSSDYARGDHTHPTSTAYAPAGTQGMEYASTQRTGGGTSSLSVSTGFKPHLLLLWTDAQPTGASVGFATGNGSSVDDQCSFPVGSGDFAGANVQFGYVGGSFAGTTISVSQMNNSAIQVSPNNTAVAWEAQLAAVGDNA